MEILQALEIPSGELVMRELLRPQPVGTGRVSSGQGIVGADAGGSASRARDGGPPGVLSKTMCPLAAMSESAGFTMCRAAAR